MNHTKPMSIKFGKEIFEAIEKAAFEAGMKKSELVREKIKKALITKDENKQGVSEDLVTKEGIKNVFEELLQTEIRNVHSVLNKRIETVCEKLLDEARRGY